MMHKQELFVLPFPSTALMRDPILRLEEGDAVLPMDFDDEGRKRPTLLRFVKQRALRKRSEIYCRAWHIENTYDTVCEVHDSDWVAELRRDAVPDWRDRWVMRHFIIYVESFGCLEVVAESAVLDDESDKNSTGTRSVSHTPLSARKNLNPFACIRRDSTLRTAGSPCRCPTRYAVASSTDKCTCRRVCGFSSSARIELINFIAVP